MTLGPPEKIRVVAGHVPAVAAHENGLQRRPFHEQRFRQLAARDAIGHDDVRQQQVNFQRTARSIRFARLILKNVLWQLYLDAVGWPQILSR